LTEGGAVAYLFVDRILEVETRPGAPLRARGLKAVARADPYLRPGGDGGLELPACLAGEALGQLAAWLSMSRMGFRRRPVAGLTAEVEVRGAARPGDIIELEVEVSSLEEDAVEYGGSARVDGEPVLVLRGAVGPLLPMEMFDDARAVEREFEGLLRPGEEPVGGPGDLTPRGERRAGARPLSGPSYPADEALPFLIDRIVERDADRILAVTCVPRTAPYLEGHFPRNPVLPATLLLDAQAGLAAALAAREDPAGPFRPARVTRLLDLKMREFIRPGSRLLSEVRIREREPGRAAAQLTGRIGGRVVSTASVEIAVGGTR
jgi:3-hydroxymyristoyl/3-hydroxydecanoyl-(acyl carrier protein) dehydratase